MSDTDYSARERVETMYTVEVLVGLEEETGQEMMMNDKEADGHEQRAR